jgi:hypothetical protein
MERPGLKTALAVAAIVACNGDVAGGGPPSNHGSTATIGTAGGELDGPDGVVVKFPPGAVAMPTTFTAGPANAIPPLPASNEVYASQVFSLEPHGFTFAAPVTVQIPITGSGAGFEVVHASCATGTETCQPWDATPVAGAQFQARTATVQTQSFSLYAVVAPSEAVSDGGAPGDGTAPSDGTTPTDGGADDVTLGDSAPAIPVVDVSTTMGYACAVAATGTVYCSRITGPQGLPANNWTPQAGLPGAMKSVSAGWGGQVPNNQPGACAIDSAGAIWCWNDGSTPSVVAGLPSGATAVSVGSDFACALFAGGDAMCWGSDSVSQLGPIGCYDGGPDASCWDGSGPAQPFGLASGVTAISASWDPSGSQLGTACALAAGGAVECWGQNEYDQVGSQSMLQGGNVPVNTPQVVPTLASGAKAISVGMYSTCAVNATGGVVCWGKEQMGSNVVNGVTLMPVPLAGLSSGVTAVSAGTFGCALTAGGGAVCWTAFAAPDAGADGGVAPPVPVPGLSSGVSRISVGATHACAVTTDQRLFCWDSTFQPFQINL